MIVMVNEVSSQIDCCGAVLFDMDKLALVKSQDAQDYFALVNEAISKKKRSLYS